MSRTTRLIRFARHWHARIGVLAALFFLFLSITGIAINHTSTFKLGARPVATHWLMHWYGLHAEAPGQGYLFEQGYFVWDDRRWVMDDRVLPVAPQPVIGAVEVAGLRYLATASTIYLYQRDGSLVDKMTGPDLPAASLSRIGKEGEIVLVESLQGVFASEDGMNWQPLQTKMVIWSQPQTLPAQVRRKIEPLFAPSLSLERVLLDVHSGRIFGRYGPLAMDFAALVLMALSISGIWMYFRSIRKRH